VVDRLVLEGMRFFAHHGDVEAERELGSHVYVDVEVRADLSAAGSTDSLDATLDYVRCYGIVRDVVENRQYRLLEAVAENIARALLEEQPRPSSVRVRVAKHPPIAGDIGRFAVIIERAGAPLA
jgi:dihydroneopterin aldolase